jgi:Dolichyl-phosphate-mannose-protein mannosyltransferase
MREKIINWSRNNFGLILAVVLYLAATSYRFFSQGLVNWDESFFAVTTNTYANIIRAVASNPIGFLHNSYFFQPLLAGYNNVYTAARPSYIMLAVIANLCGAGIFSTKIISLISGQAALVFFYLLLPFYGIKGKTKIAAIFLLAASPLFLIYSRLGLSQILSAAAFLACWYYLVRFREKEKSGDLIAAGISLAILCLSHYNSFPVVAMLFAAGILIIFLKHSNWKKYFSFIFYFLIFPIAWELITRAGAFIASAKHTLNPAKGIVILPYSGEIAQQFGKAGAGNGFSTEQILYYLKLIVSNEGAIFCVLFVVGFCIFVLNFKKIKYWLFLSIPLIYLALYSAVPFKFPRNIIIILPALYLFAALGLKFCSRLAGQVSGTGKKTILAAFILALIVLNAGQYKNILNIQTHFADIASFIKNNFSPNDIVVFSNSAPVWRDYLPGYKSEAFAEIDNPADALPGKKIIFINDYFSAVKGGQEIPAEFSAQLIFQTETNIFQVKPVVLDLIYQSEEKNTAMFAANQISPILVYELTRQ